MSLPRGLQLMSLSKDGCTVFMTSLQMKGRKCVGIPRPIYRASLGHTLFYCQGALFPWSDKTCNQFLIQFFTISRRNHPKWFCCYINHTSGHALLLKQTMNRPLIPNSYPFFIAEIYIVYRNFFTQTELTLRMCSIPDEVAREAY